MSVVMIRVDTAPINPAVESAALAAALARQPPHTVSAECGATVTFAGQVRASQDGQAMNALEIEHYPGMTEAAIAAMVAQAQARFELLGAAVRHRVGRLAVGETIVWVGALAGHRQAAFEGCAFLMDYIKTQAPFWKKARLADGSARWVAATAADDAALARWGVASPANHCGPAALAPR